MNSMNGQSPQQEAQERLAESIPVYMLPRVMAAEDYRLSQKAYRRRVAEAEAAGWAAMGNHELAAAALKAAEEDMGEISIRGDTHTHQYFGVDPRAQQQPAQPPAPLPAPTTPAPATAAGWLKPLLIGAALAGTGAGGYAAYDYFSSPTAVVEAQPNDSDWKLGLEVKDR